MKDVWRDWLRLFYYFQHELEEEEITQTTYESMVDCLMTFKPEDPDSEE